MDTRVIASSASSPYLSSSISLSDFILKTTSHWSRCIVLILPWWLPASQCYSHCVKSMYTGILLFNPHSTNIFHQLNRPRFTICTYQNETDCLCLYYMSYFTSFTWHITWMRIRKVPLQHSWATFLSYKQKMEWPSEPNEQNIQYPITSLIFVIESQTLCLYPSFQGQGNQFLHLICNWRNI